MRWHMDCFRNPKPIAISGGAPLFVDEPGPELGGSQNSDFKTTHRFFDLTTVVACFSRDNRAADSTGMHSVQSFGIKQASNRRIPDFTPSHNHGNNTSK